MLEYKVKERDDKTIDSLRNITVERGSTPSEALVAKNKVEQLLNKKTNNNNLVIHKDETIQKNENKNNSLKTYKNKSNVTTTTETQLQPYTEMKLQVKTKTKTDTQLQTQVKTEVQTNIKTKNHLICPVCGNDNFYGGACGGSAQNILCDNCFTEFNNTIVHLYNYGIPDLKRLRDAYGIRPVEVKRKNLNSYNEMLSKSSLFQKIFYN